MREGRVERKRRLRYHSATPTDRRKYLLFCYPDSLAGSVSNSDIVSWLTLTALSKDKEGVSSVHFQSSLTYSCSKPRQLPSAPRGFTSPTRRAALATSPLGAGWQMLKTPEPMQQRFAWCLAESEKPFGDIQSPGALQTEPAGKPSCRARPNSQLRREHSAPSF